MLMDEGKYTHGMALGGARQVQRLKQNFRGIAKGQNQGTKNSTRMKAW